MKLCFRFLLVTMALCYSFAGGTEVDTADLPALVKCALDTYALEEGGDVVYDRYLDYTRRIPNINESYRIHSRRLRVDHSLQSVVLLEHTVGSRSESAALLRSEEDSLNASPLVDEYAEYPFNRAFSADYAYSSTTPSPIDPKNSPKFHFNAVVRDSRHGDGDIWIDSSSCEFERIVIVPSAFPAWLQPYHVSGVVKITFGAVTGSFRDITRVEAHFVGHRDLISGTVDYDETYAGYRRFANAADARRALSTAAPPSPSP